VNIDNNLAISYLKNLKIDQDVLRRLILYSHKRGQFKEAYKYILDHGSAYNELKHLALKTLILMNDYKKLCEYVKEFDDNILFDIYKIISDYHQTDIYESDIVLQLKKLNKSHELAAKLIDYCCDAYKIIGIFNIFTEKGIMYNPDLIYGYISEKDNYVEWVSQIKNLESIDNNKYTFLMYVIKRNINKHDDTQKRIYNQYDYEVIEELLFCGANPKYEINEPPYTSPLSLAVKCHDDIILMVMKAINKKEATIENIISNAEMILKNAEEIKARSIYK